MINLDLEETREFENWSQLNWSSSLRNINRKAEFNKTTFIDLQKAFDKIYWKDFFKTLEKIGVDYRDRGIINNIYKE